jgi:hypothetical protein
MAACRRAEPVTLLGSARGVAYTVALLVWGRPATAQNAMPDTMRMGDSSTHRTMRRGSWNGNDWGMPNISAAQDWDHGPPGAGPVHTATN